MNSPVVILSHYTVLCSLSQTSLLMFFCLKCITLLSTALCELGSVIRSLYHCEHGDKSYLGFDHNSARPNSIISCTLQATLRNAGSTAPQWVPSANCSSLTLYHTLKCKELRNHVESACVQLSGIQRLHFCGSCVQLHLFACSGETV